MENPAVLVLDQPGSKLLNCTIICEGYAWVTLFQAHGSTVRGNTFKGGKRWQLMNMRTNNLLVENNRFEGNSNDISLYAIVAGDPWAFPDAAKTGFGFVNKPHRFGGGTNRFQHVNPLIADRRGEYRGGDTINISYAGLQTTFKPSAAHFNKWIVWGKDNAIHDLEFIRATETGATLKWDGALKQGPFRWITYNPDAFVLDNVIRGNTFIGPGMSSGFSGYSCKNTIVEGNTATGFTDYGLGLEWPFNCTMRDNVASGNQAFIDQYDKKAKTWNQIEAVSPVGPVWMARNVGQEAEVTHFYPQGLIKSDKPIRPPLKEWATIGD